MTIIYQPTGKAREYSPYALNPYIGCDHGCDYCYVPSCTRRKDASLVPHERKDLIKLLDKELAKNGPPPAQILLSFLCDPYCHYDEQQGYTRAVLEVLLAYGCCVAILTKGGIRALRDLDLFYKFGDRIKVGATLTFVSDKLTRTHEPGAALFMERIDMLRILKRSEVSTWASIEPVLYPEESLRAIGISLGVTDAYKVGKLNHNKEIEERINWHLFLKQSVGEIRRARAGLYIKEDLRAFAFDFEMTPEECDPDHLVLRRRVA
jgi:DNA repair photolyase